MSKNVPTVGVALGAIGCAIGLAILMELQELNYNTKRSRYLNIVVDDVKPIVPMDEQFRNLAEASEIIIDQAEKTVENVKAKRNSKGRFAKTENLGDDPSLEV